MMILLAAFLAVYLESAINVLRQLVGTQVDVLPALMVYAALTGGPGTIALLAVLGGLWFDSLSANPPGVSILPLLVIGAVIQANRTIILRDESFAQFVLGLAASAGAPILAVVLLVTLGENPLIGWASLWQLGIMTLGGAVLTPLIFILLDRLQQALTYPLATPDGFRPDREIKRGRV
jgi:cell shape-determining protein MreD